LKGEGGQVERGKTSFTDSGQEILAFFPEKLVIRFGTHLSTSARESAMLEGSRSLAVRLSICEKDYRKVEAGAR